MRSYDPERLPADWYSRFKDQLIAEYTWQQWRSHCNSLERHRTRFGGLSCLNIYDRRYKEDMHFYLPLDLSAASYFFNTSAVMYLAPAGRPGQNCDEADREFPTDPSKWLREVHDIWKAESTDAQKRDDRYVVVPVYLPLQLSVQYWTWIGLDRDPPGSTLVTPQQEEQQEDDLHDLIRRHLELCDQIEPGVADLPPYGSVSPILRSVLVLCRDGMAPARTVLLVLTGNDEEMESGPVEFDIPPTEVVSERSESVLEVSLATAIRFLIRLEKKEDTANYQYRTLNETRRATMAAGLVQEAKERVEEQRRSGSLTPHFCLRSPWKCVADSQQRAFPKL